jgi:hypothetical protein
MPRIDMVRSYLEKLAASVWDGAVMDEQGFISIRVGSAIVAISAVGEDSDLVHVGAVVAADVPATPALFEWLNEQNCRSGQVKVSRRKENNTVQAAMFVPTEEINEARLKSAVGLVGSFTDGIDDALVTTLGGRLPSPPPSTT